MTHSSKLCTCGARFHLQVELAVHCHSTGHRPVLLAAAGPAGAPVNYMQPPQRRTHSGTWKLSLVAAATLLCLSVLTCGANELVRKYTNWQGTPNVLMLP